MNKAHQATVETCGPILGHDSLGFLHEWSPMLLLLDHEELGRASHQ